MTYIKTMAVRKFSQFARLNKIVTLRSISSCLFGNSIQALNSSIYLCHGHSAANYSTKEEPLSQTQIQICSPLRQENVPAEPLETVRAEYVLTFTCKSCQARSTHRISKQGYNYGSVLAACPRCKNRHLISDHLKIFGDKNVSIEDLMRDQGQHVKTHTSNGFGTFEKLFGKNFKGHATE